MNIVMNASEPVLSLSEPKIILDNSRDGVLGWVSMESSFDIHALTCVICSSRGPQMCNVGKQLFGKWYETYELEEMRECVKNSQKNADAEQQKP
jgi:hypothetical protein